MWLAVLVAATLGCSQLTGLDELEVRADAANAVTDSAATETNEAETPPPPDDCKAIVTGGACPEGMARLKGGCFLTEAVEGAVTINSFCLDRTEVTLDAYKACVRDGKCPEPPTEVTLGPTDDPSKKSLYDIACNARHPDRGNHPINCLEWERAKSYCELRGARLPTNNELEWAMRGGAAGTPYPWGSAVPRAQLCWSGIASAGSTCPVGAFPEGDDPNGVHDLAGNVAEWSSTEQPGLPSAVAVRGGSWAEVDRSRIGWGGHFNIPKVWRNNTIGFRCVATP